MAFLLKYEKYNYLGFLNLIFYFFRWATKLAIVGGATVLVVNHEVFGANKYTQRIINKIRTSLPDTAEAFDQMPTRQELNNVVIDTWNSGKYIKICFFIENIYIYIFRLNLGVQKSFKWLVDAPMHTRRLISSIKS